MKKTTILLVIILALAMVVGLAACSGGELKPPKNVSISGNTLSWDEVKNASGYVVNVDGSEEYETKNTFFTYTTDVKGKHTVKVKAKGEGKYTDSKYSEEFEFNVTTALVSPVLIGEDKGDTYDITWSAIENATSYEVLIGISFNDVDPISVTDTKYSIDKKNEAFSEAGVYQIKVRAITTNDDYSASAWSNVVNYTNSRKLTTPTEFKYEKERLKWTMSEEEKNATHYRITAKRTDVADGKIYTYETTSKDTSISNLKIEQDGQYDISVVAYNRDNGRVYTDSDPSEVIKFTKLKKVDATTFRLSGTTLSWDKVDGAKGYSVTATTNQSNMLTLSVDSADTVSLDLEKEERFKESVHAGRIFTFSIVAVGDDEKNVLESAPTELAKGSYYQYVPKESDYADDNGNKNSVIPKFNEEGKYYEISEYPQLIWAINQDTSGKEFRLTKNININNTEWVMGIYDFKGVFDGQGHTISGIKMSDMFTRESIAIFGNIAKNAVVKNVSFSSVSVSVDSLANTALVANTNNGSLSNVIVEGSITVNGNVAIGAVVYENRGDMDSVISKVTLKAANVGAIAVRNIGTISNSESLSKVTAIATEGESIVGGFVAYNSGSISYSFATGDVQTDVAGSVVRSVIGGFVGVNEGTITYSYSMGNVVQNSAINGITAYGGGFVGDNRGTVKYCYVQDGTISRSDTIPVQGGFAGKNTSIIESAYSVINIRESSNPNKAGFVGDNVGGTVRKSAYNKDKVGGLGAVIAGKEGSADIKDYTTNNMSNAIETLGDEYVTYSNFRSTVPVLKKVIYFSDYDIKKYNQNVDITTISVPSNSKYYFMGEERSVEGEIRTNSFAGYQIVKYTDKIGDDAVVYNRLIEVK